MQRKMNHLLLYAFMYLVYKKIPPMYPPNSQISFSFPDTLPVDKKCQRALALLAKIAIDKIGQTTDEYVYQYHTITSLPLSLTLKHRLGMFVVATFRTVTWAASSRKPGR